MLAQVLLFVTTALLLCADPVHQPQGASVADAVEVATAQGELPVVASSPLPAGYEVGSHYGYRTSTRTGNRTFHAGADFLGPRGTPVYAVRGGVVEIVTSDTRATRRFAGYGNAVVVHHPDLDVWTFYAHLDEVSVESGDTVAPGQPLGVVGNTTNGRFPHMVPHLHFEVRRARSDGSSPFPGAYRQHNVDPERWLASMGVRFDHDHNVGGDDPVLVVAECEHGHARL